MTPIFIYLTFAVAYVLFFSVASKFPRKTIKKHSKSNQNPNFLYMIPAYKEDGVIVETAKNVLSQADFGENDEVVVIADQLKKETIKQLEALEVTVVKVFFEKSTKAKAINIAMKALSLWRKKHDAIVLLDADNHLVTGFISQTKEAFAQGNKIIQTHRIAKNFDTPMAKLDAISEEINNSIFRLGHQSLGLSAALIGSGLVMDFELFKYYLKKIDVVSGFDKQLELDIMADKLKIEYLPNAYILDEKVRNTQVFETQRTRWIAAQWNFAKQNFVKAWIELLTKGNVDFFNKVIQFILPPRLILLGLLTIMLIISILSKQFIMWTIILNVSLWISFLLATPTYLFKSINFKTIQELPLAFWSMTKAIFKIGKAKQTFLHTPHGA